MDAGDWISLGSLIVAAGSVLLGWLQTRGSAREAKASAGSAEVAAEGAKRSADAAEKMLPLAERSANAAGESATAAHRSADVAEAVRHREDAPDWHVAYEQVEAGLCLIIAEMLSGPTAVDVMPFFSGQIWGPHTGEGRVESRLIADRLDTVKSVHRGGHVRFPLVLPRDLGAPSRIEVTVVLTSVPGGQSEPGAEVQPWDYARTVHWRQGVFFVGWA